MSINDAALTEAALRAEAERKEKDIAQGKALLSTVQDNSDRMDVSELVVGLMEFLISHDLGPDDIKSSKEEIVMHMQRGIAAVLAERVAYMRRADAEGYAVTDLLKDTATILNAHQGAMDEYRKLCTQLCLARQIEKDPFAAAMNDTSGHIRILEIGKMGEGANPSSRQSIHDAGFFQTASAEAANHGEEVTELDPNELEAVDEDDQADISVVREIIRQPPALFSQRS